MFNKKKQPQGDDDVQQFNRLLENLIMLLLYVENQCQLALSLGQVPLPQLYLIDLIYQRLALLLGGDLELVKKFRAHTTEGISYILKALQDYRDNPEGSPLHNKDTKTTFEELMKGLNISGINVNGTGESQSEKPKTPDDLKKDLEIKKDNIFDKFLKDKKSDIDKTEKPKDNEKKDEDKEKDHPTGNEDPQV